MDRLEQKRDRARTSPPAAFRGPNGRRVRMDDRARDRYRDLRSLRDAGWPAHPQGLAATADRVADCRPNRCGAGDRVLSGRGP